MIEREVKARVDCSELAQIREEIRQRCIEKGVVIQTDYYYNHPCRDFSRTDEAVRVRIEGGDEKKITLTYKGPRKNSLTKIREEINVELMPGQKENLLLFLEKNGFREAGVVKKRRERFECNGLEYSLDTVKGLGCFIEIESLDENLSPLEELERTGLSNRIVERTYLEMVLEKFRG